MHILRDISRTSDDYVRDDRGRVLVRLERVGCMWCASPETVDGRPPRHVRTDGWATVAWQLLEQARIGELAPADPLTRKKLGNFIRA
jgi:hypothetical protein